MEGVRAVRFVFHLLAILPFADGLARDVVACGQRLLWQVGLTNLSAYQMGGSGLAVKGLAHSVIPFPRELRSVIMRSRALNKGQLRTGI